jgi:hypothetical protein
VGLTNDGHVVHHGVHEEVRKGRPVMVRHERELIPRSATSEGEPCPLCGKVEEIDAAHPDPDTDEIDDLRAQLGELRAAIQARAPPAAPAAPAPEA